MNWRIWANGARETLAGAFGHEDVAGGAVKLGPIIAKKKKKKKKKKKCFPSRIFIAYSDSPSNSDHFSFWHFTKKIFFGRFFSRMLATSKKWYYSKTFVKFRQNSLIFGRNVSRFSELVTIFICYVFY